MPVPFAMRFATSTTTKSNIQAVYDEDLDVSVVVDALGNRVPLVMLHNSRITGTETMTEAGGESTDTDISPADFCAGGGLRSIDKPADTRFRAPLVSPQTQVTGTETFTKEQGEGTDTDVSLGAFGTETNTRTWDEATDTDHHGVY